MLRPQTSRDGMAAATLSVQRLSPLNIFTELLKQLTWGLLPLWNTQENLTIPRFLTPEATDGYGSTALSLEMLDRHLLYFNSLVLWMLENEETQKKRIKAGIFFSPM